MTRRPARVDDNELLELLRLALRPPPARPTRQEIERFRRDVWAALRQRQPGGS